MCAFAAHKRCHNLTLFNASHNKKLLAVVRYCVSANWGESAFSHASVDVRRTVGWLAYRAARDEIVLQQLVIYFYILFQYEIDNNQP
jgi:hypothetical protein